MITLFQAIKSLKPTSNFTVRQDESIVWQDTENTQPSRAEIDAEVIRLQAVYDAQEYARKRAAEYPSIADQLDNIYHNGTDAWKATIKTTKDKYPKP
jgi:predicted lipoprotein